MNLKNQLKHYLEVRELNISSLARKAGVPKQTISEWLTGRSPTISQLKKVADVLGTNVDHLCFGDGTDDESKKITELDALLGDRWISGLFEVRFRRVVK